MKPMYEITAEFAHLPKPLRDSNEEFFGVIKIEGTTQLVEADNNDEALARVRVKFRALADKFIDALGGGIADENRQDVVDGMVNHIKIKSIRRLGHDERNLLENQNPCLPEKILMLVVLGIGMLSFVLLLRFMLSGW